MAVSENEPTNSTSGEEEEEEVSTEGSESESEPEPETQSSKKIQLVSNSSSDSESDPEKPDPSIKPISSKPMDIDIPPAKKPRSKNPTPRYSPSPLNQSTGKRSPEDNDGGDVKRVKKPTVVGVAAPDAPENEVGGEKKNLFQRLWSEENEIELIQGMIDYVEQKGKDPLADVNDFYDFVNDSLHIDVNFRQVLTKGKRLKKKFQNNVAKVLKSGKDRSFSNPHEKRMYELSKNLWGSDSNNNVVMNSSSRKAKVKVNVTPKTDKKSSKMVKTDSLGNGNSGIEVGKGKGVNVNGFDVLTDEMIMSKGLELMSGAKKVEMEEKWEDLKVQELELFVKKADFLKEQAEMVLNAIKKSGGAK